NNRPFTLLLGSTRAEIVQCASHTNKSNRINDWHGCASVCAAEVAASQYRYGCTGRTGRCLQLAERTDREIALGRRSVREVRETIRRWFDFSGSTKSEMN